MQKQFLHDTMERTEEDRFLICMHVRIYYETSLWDTFKSISPEYTEHWCKVLYDQGLGKISLSHVNNFSGDACTV